MIIQDMIIAIAVSLVFIAFLALLVYDMVVTYGLKEGLLVFVAYTGISVVVTLWVIGLVFHFG